MAALSAGWAAGARHCTHVAQVAGPLGVMTTNAVTGPDCFGSVCCGRGRCWAEAAAVAATAMATMEATKATEPNLLVRPPIVRPLGGPAGGTMTWQRLAILLSG